MTNSQDIELRPNCVEIDMAELRQSISELRLRVSKLYEQTIVRQREAYRRFEESRQQADQDRALMLQLIQAIAQGRNGGES